MLRSRARTAVLVSNSMAAEAVAKIRQQIVSPGTEVGLVGLDCEWARVGKGQRLRGVEVVQIAPTIHSHDAAVFRCGLGIPVELLKLLEDPSVIKVAVGVLDAVMLKRSGAHVHRIVDLQRMTRFLGEFSQVAGLEAMYKALCGKRLALGKDLQCSNWSATELSLDQVDYAAQDAVASLEVFAALKDRHAPGMSTESFAQLFEDRFAVTQDGELKRDSFQKSLDSLWARTDLTEGIRTAVKESSSRKFYAVAVGRKPGIYATWADCQKQVIGFSEAIFKGFASASEAEGFLARHGVGSEFETLS